MSTIREQLMAGYKTAINTNRPVGIPEAIRTRIDSPSPDQLPALTVYQSTDTVNPMREERAGRTSRGPVIKRKLLFNVEVLTKAGDDEEPDKAADPILAWVTAAVAGAGTLYGLANNPADERGTKFEYEQRDCSFCRATMAFEVEYQTRADNAELSA